MIVKSTKMPPNQDFGTNLKSAYQAARVFARDNPSTTTLLMLKGVEMLPERVIECKNKSAIHIVTNQEEFEAVDVKAFDFFVYGPNTIDLYFCEINQIN